MLQVTRPVLMNQSDLIQRSIVMLKFVHNIDAVNVWIIDNKLFYLHFWQIPFSQIQFFVCRVSFGSLRLSGIVFYKEDDMEKQQETKHIKLLLALDHWGWGLY